MAKYHALKRSWRLARYGSDQRSRGLLFRIGVVNQLDHLRRAGLIRQLHSAIAEQSSSGLLRVRLRAPRPANGARAFPVQLRAGDTADYQSLFECLGTDMYSAPPYPVRHVFDAGANLGFFSIAAVYLTGARDIVLVEPHPGNAALLRQNVKHLSKFGISVKVWQAALGEHIETVVFNLASSNTSHIQGAPGHEDTQASESISVRCRRIVNLVPRNWNMKRTWLKLDIEGGEHAVIRDLLQSALRPAIISAEIHDYLHSGGVELVNALVAAGYQVDVAGVGQRGNVCRQIQAVHSDSVS